MAISSLTRCTDMCLDAICPGDIKGVDKKTLHLNFCFAHISASICRIFKILVPTPHNIPLIMGGRHKNFKDPMYRS